MPAARDTIDPVMVTELADRLSNNLHVREDREEVLQSSTTSIPNAPRCTLPTQSSELPSLDVEGSEACFTASGPELSPPISMGGEYDGVTLLLEAVNARLIWHLSREDNNNHNGISNNGAGDNNGDNNGDNTGDNGTGDNTGDDDTGDNTSISTRIADVCFDLCCGRELLDELHLHMERVYGWAVEAGLTTDPSSLAASLRTDVVGYQIFGKFKDCENRTEDDWWPSHAYTQLVDRLAAQILELENYINPNIKTEFHEIMYRLNNGLYVPLDAAFIDYFRYRGFNFLSGFIVFCQEAGRLATNVQPSDTEREDHRANIANLLLDIVRAA